MPLSTDELVRKALTQTSNLQAGVPQIWAASIEKNLRKRACLQPSVVEFNELLVPNSGDTVYVPFLPDIALVDQLTEGTDMTPIALSNATSVPLVPTEFGKSVAISRKALDRFKYDGVAEIIDRLTYAMTLRIEGNIAALWNQAVPNTSNKMTVTYPNGHTTSTIVATDTFNDALIWDGVQRLEAANNAPFDDGYFRLYISPSQASALFQDQNVRNDLRYGAPERIFTGELGVLHKCRIIVSNFVPTASEGSGGSVTTYKALLLAPRWAAMAWKRRPGIVVDPTLYDMGRRRNFGVLADFDTQLLHYERGIVITSA